MIGVLIGCTLAILFLAGFSAYLLDRINLAEAEHIQGMGNLWSALNNNVAEMRVAVGRLDSRTSDMSEAIAAGDAESAAIRARIDAVKNEFEAYKESEAALYGTKVPDVPKRSRRKGK